MSNRILALFLFVACSLSSRAQVEANDSHNYSVEKNLELFNYIYKSLDMMYVDTLDADKVVGYAVDAMLSYLDPYTEYYPESKQGDLKMLMSGKYAGIGSMIRYNLKLKRVVIDEPYENMPAAEVGLKKGDIIISIDDSIMTDKDVSYVSEHLRGEPGTSFVLKILRPTTGKTMKFNIKRKSIQLPHISYYGLQPNGVGYLSLTSFTGDDVAKEFRRAFIDLKNQGMKKFVLDLRDNGGGSLSEAVEIVNMFVPKGLTIVETKGKLDRSNQKYVTGKEPVDTEMPIVVLVNGGTASAAEITCGSLQDLDRAVVMGTRTFGKGLVQYPNLSLPYNSNLKLTTGRYNIPSGRCIQAINYKHGDSGRYVEHVPDSLTKVFHTANGREVRDGGGIKPDCEVKSDTIPNIAYYLTASARDSTESTLNWEINYIKNHKTIPSPDAFSLSDADYEDFMNTVIANGFKYDRESGKYFSNLVKVAKFEGYYDDARQEFDALEKKLSHNLSKDLEYNKNIIKQMLEMDIVSAYYYQRGQVQYSLRYDNQYKAAVELLNDMERYNSILRP